MLTNGNCKVVVVVDAVVLVVVLDGATVDVDDTGIAAVQATSPTMVNNGMSKLNFAFIFLPKCRY